MEPEKKRLAAALGLALFAAALAWTYLYVRERQLLSSAEELKVLVAKRYIPANTRLEGGALAWQRIPRAFVPKGAITDAGTALGLQTLVPFNQGEPVLYNKLAEQGQALAASVPEGKRAVSLPVNAVSGVSGLLRPGDHVDAMLLYGQGPASQAGLLLQDINVLAVGSDTDGHENRERAAGTITLALSPEEAAVALVAVAQGQLHLALRATGDARVASIGRSGWADVLKRIERPSLASPEAARDASAAPAVEDFIPHKR
jgi:pilus assembly protein CpaB